MKRLYPQFMQLALAIQGGGARALCSIGEG